MKNKIDLNTERMKGFGPYVVDNCEVNYLFGLNDLCENYITDNFTVLELGSNDGISTALFSYFANKVVSVDINRTNSMDKILSENNNIEFHHMSFEEFLKKDKDNKYDLIYIDGNHDFNSVLKDIDLFKNKVKIGGYLSGHDFNTSSPGVRKAVESYFNKEEITLFSDSSWLVKINKK